jgi:GntR family transcriptional regulator
VIKLCFKNWNPGEKLISIRELATSLEVNPNTVQRTYDLLQQLNIISNKRGVGYFIDTQAEDKIVSFRKEQFFKEELPQFLKTIYLLKIDIKEINDQYSNFIQDQKNK